MPLTYDETRLWVSWVRIFTPSDLADTMGVQPEVIDGFIKGLLHNHSIEDTGDRVNGTAIGEEPIYAYLDFMAPADPPYHPHGRSPEEIAVMQMGGYEILSPRGMPIRIRTERDNRKTMSTPGARGRIKRREARYHQMQKAVRERAAKQQERERQLIASGAKSGKRKLKRKDFQFE